MAADAAADEHQLRPQNVHQIGDACGNVDVVPLQHRLRRFVALLRRVEYVLGGEGVAEGGQRGLRVRLSGALALTDQGGGGAVSLPAAPAPAGTGLTVQHQEGVPSAIMPLPTPVPSVMSTMLRQPTAAPATISASAAQLASLLRRQGRPRRWVTMSHTGTSNQPRLYARTTTPRLLSQVPGEPMPMLEQCREIVHKFNAVYGETLTEPEILLPSNHACLRLPGIDGKAKMSKSLGNCIYLADQPDDIRTKVMGMFTDPNHLQVSDPGRTEGNPVFMYLDAFCTDEHFARYLPDYANLDELKAHYQRGGLGDVKVKKFLNNVLQETLEPIRNRRKELEKDIPAIYEMLKKGSEEAEKVAAQTLADVKAAMKINYFDDLDLIRSQAERYGK